MSSLRPQRVKSRLTLWFVSMLAGVLGVYLAVVSVLLHWQINNVLKRLAKEDVETIKGLLYFGPDGQLNLREDFHHHTYWKQVEERLVEVLSPDGTVLYRNDRLGNRTMGGPPFPGEGIQSYSDRIATLSDGTSILLVSREYALSGRKILIREGYNEELVWNRLKETLTILLLALPLALAATAYGGYKMASRALDPIEQISRRAEEISSENLNERLPIENPEDELGHLATVINHMLAKIEVSFAQLRRFTSDASHELRTPLAAIRSIGEVSLQKEAGTEAYRDTIGSMLEEVDRLTNIVESLLTLSRADAGQVGMDVSVFPIMSMVREVADLLEVLIEEKQLVFTLSGEEDACVRVDRLYLRQAITNIIHNAVKFTPAGGRISAHIGRGDHSRIVLAVTDSGPGIQADHLERVFERFYRTDHARAGENSGAGLGLAIAKWAVEASNGEIGVSSPPGGGCIFWISLPSASSHASAHASEAYQRVSH